MALSREKTEQVIADMYAGISVKRACEKLNLKTTQAFHNALTEYPDLQESYDRAQQAKAEDFAEEVVDIADEEENPMKAKNRIDARRWYAAVMKPKKFAERIDLNLIQTVDMRGALEEARSRVLLPARDLNLIQKVKPIEITATNSPCAPDSEPVVADATALTSEDLLK